MLDCLSGSIAMGGCAAASLSSLFLPPPWLKNIQIFQQGVNKCA